MQAAGREPGPNPIQQLCVDQFGHQPDLVPAAKINQIRLFQGSQAMRFVGFPGIPNVQARGLRDVQYIKGVPVVAMHITGIAGRCRNENDFYRAGHIQDMLQDAAVIRVVFGAAD